MNDIPLQKLSRRSLKTLLRERHLGTATWRRCAKKAQLIKALETGVLEDSAGHGEGSNAIRSMVAQMIREASVGSSKTIEVKLPSGEIRNVGRQHNRFERLLKLAIARVNTWMVGPAGSGKTSAAKGVADALGLPFFFNGAIDSEHKLLGFVDAGGKIVSRPFREAYENGGVYLFDEIDASMPSALLAFNAALANGFADFPDRCVNRHPDCIIIAAGNVYDGATTEYVGRMKQDKAFQDRFVILAWPYDEEFEREIAGNDAWVSYVQKVRALVLQHGVKVVVSPRASIYGATLLAHGFPREEVIEMTIRKGLSEAEWLKIAA